MGEPTDGKPGIRSGFTRPTDASRLAFIIACCHLSMSMMLHADEPAPARPGALRFEVRLGAGAIPGHASRRPGRAGAG